MDNKFDYKNFYSLLEIKNSKEKEFALKDLIDTYFSKHFEAEDRRWFNTLISKGLVNLIYHCERTIPYFSLFNNEQKADHFSNVGFLWAIRSGNIEMVQYFINHEDFPKFCKYENLEKQIASFVDSYRDDCHRRDCLDLNNYEQLIDILVEKFPWSIPTIFEKTILEQKNDEVTPVLKSFVCKYRPYLKDYLNNEEQENNFTRLCMVSLNHNCLEFGKFLRQQYQDITMHEEYISFYLLYLHEPFVLKWMLENPQFFELKEEHFTEVYNKCFNNPLKTKAKKEDYEFFFMVTKANLHIVTVDEMKQAIANNLTPFVKKYYKNFKDYPFDLSYFPENTCTRYIDKQLKEKQYKELLIKLPFKNIHTKKLKI